MRMGLAVSSFERVRGFHCRAVSSALVLLLCLAKSASVCGRRVRSLVSPLRRSIVSGLEARKGLRFVNLRRICEI